MPRHKAGKVRTSWKRKQVPSQPLKSVKLDHKKPQGLSEIAHYIEPANPQTASADLSHYRDYFCDHSLEVIAVVRTSTEEKKISRCTKGCGYTTSSRKPLA